MNPFTQADTPTARLQADAPPPSFVATGALLLSCALVAACAAVASALNPLTTPPRSEPSTILSSAAAAAPSTSVWEDFDTESSVPADRANFASSEWGSIPVSREAPSDDEAAPTF